MNRGMTLYAYFSEVQKFAEQEWLELTDALRIYKDANTIHNETLQAMSTTRPRYVSVHGSSISTRSDTWGAVGVKDKLRRIGCGCRDRIVSGQAFSKYQCATCGDSDMHMNTDVPDMCTSCATRLEVCAWCKRSIKPQDMRAGIDEF